MSKVDVTVTQGGESDTLVRAFEYVTVSLAWSETDIDADIALSNNNKTASKTQTNAHEGGGGESGLIVTSGKVYVEFNIDQFDNGNDSCGFSATGANRSARIGSFSDSYGYSLDGDLYADGSFNGGVYSGLTSGDVVGLAVDLDNDIYEFFKNNVSQGVESATFDASAGYVPAWSAWAATSQITIETASADQTYSPPTGFTAWGD